ncbi:SGNH/GDSL hydrolase family protein [Devosia ginsengisoli]|uniref:SGNH/GDSL hydrolase family protein n=1 Tax=Devosia ginsengisoli TaxID=400770 RepID=UPI0026EF6E70|nr:SGNH/GDSL hydrolase family protein [Devosia ginsengisoli]MCR6670539.1 SGNH/GDSL hydrolase family protein [Devosia ginsengisoli]
MTSFAERWTGRAKSLATFGDSITQAVHIPVPEDRWSNRLAERLGTRLSNRGISGTVLQSSPDASGKPRPDNGHGRYAQDLLGASRADVIAILYGTNDARYTAAPTTFTLEAFTHDYRAVLNGLFAAGYSPDAIVIGSPPHLPDQGFAVGAEDSFAGQSRQQFQLYVEAVKSIASEAGTFYAPVNERMAAEGGDALIRNDHVHPNEAGHASIAEIFAAATRPVTP